jgi:hypothetical protein
MRLALALASLLASTAALGAAPTADTSTADAATVRARQAIRCSMTFGIAATAVTDAQQKKDLGDLHDLMIALAEDDGATRAQMEGWLKEFSAEVDPDPKPALVKEAQVCGTFFEEQKSRVSALLGE